MPVNSDVRPPVAVGSAEGPGPIEKRGGRKRGPLKIDRFQY